MVMQLIIKKRKRVLIRDVMQGVDKQHSSKDNRVSTKSTEMLLWVGEKQMEWQLLEIYCDGAATLHTIPVMRYYCNGILSFVRLMLLSHAYLKGLWELCFSVQGCIVYSFKAQAFAAKSLGDEGTGRRLWTREQQPNFVALGCAGNAWASGT